MTTHIALVLDESGSMSSRRESVIKGLNAYIKGLKKAKKTRISILKFGGRTEFEWIVKDKKPKNVKKFSSKNYEPYSQTPLYDAIGRAIIRLKWKTMHEDKVLLVVMTDGHENASRKHDFASIMHQIEDRQSAGWELVYLGNEIDVVESGRRLGINTVARYDQTNIKGAMNLMAQASVGYTETGETQVEDWEKTP